jgi:hypothetical protein
MHFNLERHATNTINAEICPTMLAASNRVSVQKKILGCPQEIRA